MWNCGEDFDFGDEDDVGALLAKARIDLAPMANRGSNYRGRTTAGAVQQNTRPDGEEVPRARGGELAQNNGNTVGDRVPTVSSSSFPIKQRAASSQSLGDDPTMSFEAPLPSLDRSSRGQPLANLTNSIRSETHSQSAQSQRNVDAASSFQKDSRFANAFKVPFPKGANSQGRAGANAASRSSVFQERGPFDSTHTRQVSNASASTSALDESVPRRRFDAAEKGKRAVSESETNSRSVPLVTDAAEGETKQPRTKQTVIPGPAGAVQRALAQGRSSAEAQTASTRKQAPILLEALPDEDFSKGPWLAAVEFLRSEETRRGAVQLTQLRDLRKGAVTKRTAHLVVMVKSMTPTGDGDMFATVKDATGTLEGTLHRRLLVNKQLGPISTGTVLVLNQVAIFRPVPRTCYLNIMATNVLKVFPTKTPIPPVRSSLRAATDPTLAEPSWDGFPQIPSTSNGSARDTAQPFETSDRSFDNSPGTFWETGALRGRKETLGDADLRVGDSPGVAPRLGNQSPDLPSLSSSQGGSFGDPDIGRGQSVECTEPGARLPSSNSLGCVQTLSNRPFNRLTGTAVTEGPIPPGVSENETGRPGPDVGNAPVFSAAGRSEFDSGAPTTKRGRDGNGANALEPLNAPGGGHRGTGALNVDIQQLLAGLDEEDWFLPGEEAPPPSKKTREMEESLPF